MAKDAYGNHIHHDMNNIRLHRCNIVRYTPPVRQNVWTYGVVTSMNADYVFVHFFGDKQSKACKASSLQKG